MQVKFEDMPKMMADLISRTEAIQKQLAALCQQTNLSHQPEYATRAQVREHLHISLPTLHTWMKIGKLKPYHIGGRTLFRWDEVNNAVQPVNYDLKTKGGNL